VTEKEIIDSLTRTLNMNSLMNKIIQMFHIENDKKITRQQDFYILSSVFPFEILKYGFAISEKLFIGNSIIIGSPIKLPIQ